MPRKIRKSIEFGLPYMTHFGLWRIDAQVPEQTLLPVLKELLEVAEYYATDPPEIMFYNKKEDGTYFFGVRIASKSPINTELDPITVVERINLVLRSMGGILNHKL